MTPSSAAINPERFRRLQRILARRQDDLTVLMDRVHKPHNLAAVIRTCDAVGIGRVHIVPTEDFQPGFGSSMGADRYVRRVRHPGLADAAAALRGQGMRIVAAHPSDDAVDYRRVDYARPTALLLGTELEGLSDEAVAASDQQVIIPMHGAVTSLNVSVAAAVILYEAERQREQAGAYDRPLPDDDATRCTLFEWAYPRIADLCRRRGVRYPELDEDGRIVGDVPR
jgi:tRNA (guanosine-2'-O-)-methyltransferase